MDCIFCRIIAGELPCCRIYADEHAMAFLDLNPFQRGHTLVVPRRHVDRLTSDATALAEIAGAISATAQLLKTKLQLSGLNMIANDGAVAGQEIFHLHIHLVPRYEDNPGMRTFFSNAHQADSAELEAVREQILS